MTVLEEPLFGGNHTDMSRLDMTSENILVDNFEGIKLGPDVCGNQDLDLNSLHFSQMTDFKDINITQLLDDESEPQPGTSRRLNGARQSGTNLNMFSSQPAPEEFSSFAPSSAPAASHETGLGLMGRMVTETNELLSNTVELGSSSRLGGSQFGYDLYQRMNPPPSASYPGYFMPGPGAPPMAPSASQGFLWSSPTRASPELQTPAPFSSYNYQAQQPAGMAPASLYSAPEAPVASRGYSYQSLPLEAGEQQSLGRLTGGYGPRGSWDGGLVGAPYEYQSELVTRYSSPNGSVGELPNAGCPSASPVYAGLPTVTGVQIKMESASLDSTNALAIPASQPSGVAPTYLSQSYPGATANSTPARGGRNASGSFSNNMPPLTFCGQQFSCQSSPLSQGSSAPAPGWAEASPFHSYVANGAMSDASDHEVAGFVQEDRPSSNEGSDLGELRPRNGRRSRQNSGGSQAGHVRGKKSRSKGNYHSSKSMELWQFLWVLLSEKNGGGAVTWLDSGSGLFKVSNQTRLCDLWSKLKSRNRDRIKITRYSNLTRTLRYYYQRGLMKKGERDHVYQFIFDNMNKWIHTRKEGQVPS